MPSFIDQITQAAADLGKDAAAAIGRQGVNADTGFNTADLGLGGGDWNNNNHDGGYGGYGYGYGYGGYGGGGGSGKSAEEAQEETQAGINNAVGNYAGRGRDIQRLGKDSLGNIKEQLKQNTALHNKQQNDIMQQIKWQPTQQKEQSTLAALRSRMGNAAYGSGLVDLMEGLNRVDDMNDAELIDTWKQNSNAAYNNWFQANEDLVSDYADQAISIQDELSKLYSQYWSTMSNINPRLASAENILKSAKGEESEIGEGTDRYVLPGGTQGLLADDELRSLYGWNDARGVSHSHDTEYYSGIQDVVEALDKMKTNLPQRASAINPLTKYYVRPDRAVNKANRISNTGQRNQSTAANRGFLDNLNVYQRRV